VVQKVGATFAVVAGATVIGFNANRWDIVVLTFARGHGVHVRDIIGMLLIAIGIVTLWRT
jgi:hypothetical protein